MKRRFRRLLSIMLAAVMVLAMGTTAFADNVTTTVTVTNLSGHTFDAYQIFSGVYTDNNGTPTLSDLNWAGGVTSTTLLSKLATYTTVTVSDTDTTTIASLFDGKTSATDVAGVLETYATYTTVVNAFVEAAYAAKTTTKTSIKAGSNTLDAGYYLIVDTTEDLDATGVEVAAYNNALLQIVGTEVTIAKKTDAPSVEKKVYEESSYTTTSEDSDYISGYNDVADYDIGDSVPYQLIGSVPSTTYYSYYKYKFTDTLSKGLTVNQSSIKVYAADSKNSKDGWVEINSSSYTVSVTDYALVSGNAGYNEIYDGGTVLTVSFDNIMTVSAVNTGGTKTLASEYAYIIVEYNATLNSNAVVGLNGNPNEVYLTYSSNPNSVSAGDTDDNTEDTPEDEVIVFTYQLNITKVSASNTATTLQDAVFTLSKTVDSVTYYYAGSSTSGTRWVTDSSQAASLTTDSSGIISVVGLDDDGTYSLTETSAPSGYNKLSSAITFTIGATTSNGQSWTTGEANKALTALSLSISSGTDSAKNTTAQGNTSTGIVAMQISNTPGTGLPTTGGIGTTIFYIVGAILVVGAGVILITRRRMNRD